MVRRRECIRIAEDAARVLVKLVNEMQTVTGQDFFRGAVLKDPAQSKLFEKVKTGGLLQWD